MTSPPAATRRAIAEDARDAVGTAARISTGELTAARVLEQSLDRIAHTEPDVHALLHVDQAGSRAAAAEHDERRRRGHSTGPAGGVPIVVKDNIDVAGMVTTAGSRALGSTPANEDAELVRRLRAAGAILVGKSNLDEFAMGATTESSAYGPTHNPHDLSRTPGGSSGGSAASIAAGQVPWAVGTDTGGSIREPAAQCGIVGVKPTYGSIPDHGIVPFARSLDQAGPMARTVADTALLHSLMSGGGGFLAAARRGGEEALSGFRIGVVAQMAGRENYPTVRRGFERSVDVLCGLGAEVVEVSIPGARDGLSLYYTISSAEAVPLLGPLAEAGKLGEQSMERWEKGLQVLDTRGQIEDSWALVQILRQEVAAAFESCAVLISPTMPVVAPKLGRGSDDPMAAPQTDWWTVLANLTGIPAMSVPHGHSNETGMPLGLQIMAPHDQDLLLYRVGASIEKLTDLG